MGEYKQGRWELQVCVPGCGHEGHWADSFRWIWYPMEQKRKDERREQVATEPPAWLPGIKALWVDTGREEDGVAMLRAVYTGDSGRCIKDNPPEGSLKNQCQAPGKGLKLGIIA